MMSGKTGKKLAHLSVASLLMMSASVFPMSAYAQDSDAAVEDEDEVLEEVIVTGIRASERLAVDIKRNSRGVLEAIAAEDIGELPAPSIAESLMMLPGVTGNQDSGRSNTISVRGLGGIYTRTTLNGREIVSSFGTRSVNFSLYPGEVIRRGIVYKTATPDLIEGGVASTVDLQTIRPLAVKKNIRNVNAYYLYNEMGGKSALVDGHGYDINAMFSQKVNDKFAFVIGAVALQEDQRSERINLGDVGWAGWQLDYDDNPDTREFSSGGGGLQNHSREVNRQSVFATAQWRPSDRWEVIVDALWSNYEYETQMANIYFWGLNSNTPEYAAYRDQAIIGKNGQVMRGYAPAVNFNIAPAQVINKDTTEVFGLNTIYTGDKWTTNFDLSYSGSTREYAWMGTNAQYGDVPLMWDWTNANHPSLEIDESVDLTDTTRYGNIEKVSNPDSRSVTDLYAFKFDSERGFNGRFFSGMKWGMRYSEQSKNQREDQEEYTDEAVTSLSLLDVIQPFTSGRAFSTWDTSMPNDWLYFSPIDVLRASGHENDEREWDAADQFASYDLKEETTAAYLMFDFDSSLFGKPFYGSFGARYFDTDVTSVGVMGDYELKYLAWADDYKLIVDESTLHEDTAKSNYNDWLPSINMNLAVRDDFIIRAGIGRQVLLPRIGEMDNALNLNTGRVFSGTSKDQQRTIGTRGNPYLQPITSDQFDLSFEWYPRDNDLYSIAFFYKDMDGVYEKNADYIDVEGIDLPMPIITTVKTERSGTIGGIEVAFRTELDFLPGFLKHFALAGNYTWMDIDTVQDYNANETYKEDFDWIAYTETLYLAEGMMESTGALVLSYDDGQRWSGRLAYKYQDYVVGKDGPNYMLRRPSNFWSGSVNFRINQRFQLVAQVWNLTNEKTIAGHISSKNIGEPFPDYPRRVQADSRTWRLGIRMRF